MAGHAVGARAGRRDEYRPLESALCASSRPLAVLEGLLSLYPFRRIYVADLDAILGRGSHQQDLDSMRRAHPEVEFWVDAGFTSASAALAWQAQGLGRAVLGSESLLAMPDAAALGQVGVLSLDFRGDVFLGPPALLGQGECWPEQVIAMTLERVGCHQGPDLALLAQLRAKGPHVGLYAAGGVRHAGDLESLADAGAAGVLLASALHDGSLTRDTLAAFHGHHPRGAAIGARGNGPVPRW